MVSAVIRLGHKYQMNDLVSDAVAYLKRYYTSIFDEWATGRLYAPGAPFQKVHAIGVVNLARLVDEPLLLPTALLMCCSLGRDITTGFVREDGTREMLPLDDIGRCFAARTHLTKQMILILFHIFHPSTSNGCTTHSTCQGGLQTMLHNARAALSQIAHPDVYRSFVHAFGPWLVCTSCKEMVMKRDVDSRADSWYHLPKFFELPLEYPEWPGTPLIPKVLDPGNDFWAGLDSD